MESHRSIISVQGDHERTFFGTGEAKIILDHAEKKDQGIITALATINEKIKFKPSLGFQLQILIDKVQKSGSLNLRHANQIIEGNFLDVFYLKPK
jgi:hypothetical protein